MKITFIQTGGTIDKDYPRKTKGWAFEIGKAATIKILERVQPSFKYELKAFSKKDSLEINDEDRKQLKSYIKNLKSQQIIITHGTDTMIQTAQYLGKHIKNKTIVLTAARLPEKFKETDADFNLGAAIAGVQILDNGVYITMNGIIKPVSTIKRNSKTGKFK